MRLPLAPLAVAAALLAAPAGATADFQSLYDDYREDSVINGCSYTAGELGSGLSDIPSDVRVYDPGYPEAINLALEQLAAGCDIEPAEVESANELTASDGSPGPMPERQASLTPAAAGRDMPAALVALIVALAAAVGTASALVLAGRRGGATGSPPAAGDRDGF